jgi:hypothetical protein
MLTLFLYLMLFAFLLSILSALRDVHRKRRERDEIAKLLYIPNPAGPRTMRRFHKEYEEAKQERKNK